MQQRYDPKQPLPMAGPATTVGRLPIAGLPPTAALTPPHAAGRRTPLQRLSTNRRTFNDKMLLTEVRGSNNHAF